MKLTAPQRSEVNRLISLFGNYDAKTVYNIAKQRFPTTKEKKLETKTIGFVPKKFSEYIGQSKVKEILSNYITSIKERKSVFPHLLIHGKAGHGKTTLAKIIANTLRVPFVEVIASSIDGNELVNKIKNLKGGILFVDEVHGLDRDTVEQVYQLMETFTWNGSSIPRFTLIGATTEMGEILKSKKPFYDRFKIVLELDDYTIRDLMKIGKQYRQKAFPKDPLKDSILETIAKNCRETPRKMISLVESAIYFKGDMRKVLSAFSIIKDGFTEKDKKLLSYLAMNDIVGLQGISAFLDTSEHNYLYEIEPYLIKKGAIVRSPRGRKISESGKLLLKTLIR